MANVDRVNGFTPVSNTVTGSYNGQSREYYVVGGVGALFVGDAVKSSGLANADGVPGVLQAAAGDNMIGVIVGFKVDRENTTTEYPGYSASADTNIIYVCDDPNVIYEVQEDAVGGALALASVGLTCDHIVAAGSTTTGASGMELNTSDAGTGAGWKILGFSRKVGNEPAVANAKVLVRINEHELTGAGVGV